PGPDSLSDPEVQSARRAGPPESHRPVFLGTKQGSAPAAQLVTPAPPERSPSRCRRPIRETRVLTHCTHHRTLSRSLRSTPCVLTQVTELQEFSSNFRPISAVSPFAMGRRSAFGDVV